MLQVNSYNYRARHTGSASVHTYQFMGHLWWAGFEQRGHFSWQTYGQTSSSTMLNVPRTEHSTIGDRAFSVSAAWSWNSLSAAVQSSESLDIFRRRLKTELFARSFSDWWQTCQMIQLLRDSVSTAFCCCNLEVFYYNVALTFITNNSVSYTHLTLPTNREV